MENEKFDIAEAVKGQKEYQLAKDFPDFAPADGKCWNCGRNIYSPIKNGKHTSGYSVERASTTLITGCPHCHRSYCD